MTSEAKDLRSKVSGKRWLRMVKGAQRKTAVIEKVRAVCATEGLSQFQGLAVASPTTPWPSFQYWCRQVAAHGELSWEALLDHRIPPKQEPVPEKVASAAVMIRRLRPGMGYREAHDLLVAQFGEAGDISASSMSRVWRSSGLVEAAPVEEDVVEFHGGAGLALIGAASLETGASTAMARAILAAAQETVARQADDKQVPDEPAGRDERGRLSAEYNKSTRAGVPPGEQDARWVPDHQKRVARDLGRQRVLRERPDTLAQKALAIGVMPLITERRGFDGLDGPQGAWLELLSHGVAYKPRTLDKFLAQLGLLDVEDGLWTVHASMSLGYVSRWAAAAGAPPWLAVVMYVDSTQDPYWTRKYALSGKTSRTGRVAPCLSRISINAGPGVPFLMETFPGTISLKTELPRLLERVRGIVGDDGVERFTVIDAEMSTAKLLTSLLDSPESPFITVLKGRSVEDFRPTSEWQSYRERDQIREGVFVIRGDGAPADGLELRTVEMRRAGRHSQSTFFATSYERKRLDTTAVVDAYLSRWPNQEHLFRNARNGLGLNRSHGFGGEYVQHVALGPKKTKAHGHLQAAQELESQASQAVDFAKKLVNDAAADGKAPFRQLLKTAQAQLSAARRAVKAATKSCEKLGTTSQVIFERDTARENVVTAFTMNTLFLVEFVLREYFGGVQMELRTFIEHFVNLPVTVTTTDHEIVYRVEGNPRNVQRTEQMRKACEAVTRRGLTRGNHRLVFLMADSERTPVKEQQA